jgi:lysozyme
MKKLVLLLATLLIIAGTYIMIINQGVSFIKRMEGCQLIAYQDIGDTWTIGYGHTRGVKEGDEISPFIANAMLVTDLVLFEMQLDRLVRVDLEPHQYDALLSFIYNLGATNLKDSTLLKYVNERKFDLVPNEFHRWNKVNGVVSLGLTRRRHLEALRFEGNEERILTGEGW